MTETITIEAVGTLSDVPVDDWDALANPGWRVGPSGQAERIDPDTTHAFNPFVTHAFLNALEDAGCVGKRTGWHPRHVLVRAADDGPLIGAAPAYLKSHSQGEYVFDYGWADAFERAGGRYYPKVLSAVPFTPAQGPRILTAGDDGAMTRDAKRTVVASALQALCQQSEASSAHVNFLTEEDAATLEKAGYLIRNDTQFHWTDRGYGSWDEFLAALASRKRKQLKRERRDALANGITVRWLVGDDITEAHWDAFYGFYMDTGSRKWGRPYLNRMFFSLLGERLGHSVCLMLAERDGRTIAGALNLIGSKTLFGRYWGCTEDHPFLHFELCYYQAIDFAIDHGLSRVEAGAQGD
ncbi:MAG: GNAT family N-acetyltransferase, partial [Pseudomonadota bacterium]